MEAKPIWLFAKKDQCDACGYVVIEKTKILVKRFELIVATSGSYLHIMDKSKLQACTFIQVLSFKHANWLCN